MRIHLASADDTEVVPPGEVLSPFGGTRSVASGWTSRGGLASADDTEVVPFYFLSEGRALSRPLDVAVRPSFGGRHGGRPSG